MKKAAETMQKKAQQQYKGQQQKHTVPEGKTVIDKTPGNQQQGKKTVGEYVDYEEID